MSDVDPNEIEEALDEAGKVAVKVQQSAKPQLPEAPASATAKVMTPNGFSWLFTIRDDKASSLVWKIKAMEKHFVESGWQPVLDGRNVTVPNKPAPANSQPANRTFPSENGTAPGEPPKCSVHGTPMVWKEGTSKSGKPYAFWGCTKKNADGSFCKGKPMA